MPHVPLLLKVRVWLYETHIECEDRQPTQILGIWPAASMQRPSHRRARATGARAPKHTHAGALPRAGGLPAAAPGLAPGDITTPGPTIFEARARLGRTVCDSTELDQFSEGGPCLSGMVDTIWHSTLHRTGEVLTPAGMRATAAKASSWALLCRP